jgi:hypothetical protein
MPFLLKKKKLKNFFLKKMAGAHSHLKRKRKRVAYVGGGGH